MPLPIRLTVVSCPAKNSSTQVAQQLVLGEPIALLLGGDEPAQEIVARRAASDPHQVAEVLGQPRGRLRCSGQAPPGRSSQVVEGLAERG